MSPRFLIPALALLAALPALAQQPFGDPPPPAYPMTAEERADLETRRKALEARLDRVPIAERADAAVFLHLADVSEKLRLYTRKQDVATMLRGLDVGVERAAALAEGKSPWRTTPGRSLRGYVSRVDGSIQPYGVVLPAGFDPQRTKPWRLEVFLHGRGTSEVRFLGENEPAPGSAGARAPEEEFIQVHPFGRANNGWRWAGETDVFEVLDQVKKLYRIDPDAIVLRGFSMGGHGAWQIGIHHPGLWAAVSPGAGFSETRRHGNVKSVPEYQERAWHIYDAVDYAQNLFNTPFIAYGGEKDPQLAAAMNMKAAAEKEGLPLNVIIGPDTEHRYHPESLKEIMRQLATKRRDPDPREIRFTTWTLKYNQCRWVTVDGLEEHYRRADVRIKPVVHLGPKIQGVRERAALAGPELTVTTANVTALTLDPVPSGVTRLEIDGQSLPVKERTLHLARARGKWGPARPSKGLRKLHGLQGPIDDAFTERFLVVRPTGEAWTAAAREHAEAELKRMQEEWRFGFRGELPLKDDKDVTEADLKAANLVLLGDPGSNRVLDRLDDRLPLHWTRQGFQMAGRSYGTDAVPVLIYPNPLAPGKYVVLNTGHTFTRKDLDASNAWLFPKLGDWAALKPGGTHSSALDAGFFNEAWEYRGQ